MIIRKEGAAVLDKLYITPRQWLHVLRWTLYFLLFLLAMMIQTVVLGNRTVLGANPDFISVVIVCVCLREGPEQGGLFALLTSLFWCLSGADGGSISIAILTILPVLGSILCRSVLNNRFLPCLMVSAVTLLALHSAIFGLKYFFDGVRAALYVEKVLPCLGVSLFAQPPVYWLVKQIHRIGDKYEST